MTMHDGFGSAQRCQTWARRAIVTWRTCALRVREGREKTLYGSKGRFSLTLLVSP
jgi:hypothetical protein